MYNAVPTETKRLNSEIPVAPYKPNAQFTHRNPIRCIPLQLAQRGDGIRVIEIIPETGDRSGHLGRGGRRGRIIIFLPFEFHRERLVPCSAEEAHFLQRRRIVRWRKSREASFVDSGARDAVVGERRGERNCAGA